jgi:hypothetical protein
MVAEHGAGPHQLVLRRVGGPTEPFGVFGTVRPAARLIGANARSSDTQPSHTGLVVTISTTIAALVATIAALTAKFIGRASVVTRR